MSNRIIKIYNRPELSVLDPDINWKYYDSLSDDEKLEFIKDYHISEIIGSEWRHYSEENRGGEYKLAKKIIDGNDWIYAHIDMIYSMLKEQRQYIKVLEDKLK